jgi:hypothetical protein
MRVTTGRPSMRRQQLFLLSGLLLALFITFFFGVRAFHRFSRPPNNEPLREWMSIPYIAHSYHIPPPVLLEALDLPTDTPPSRRPLSRIAQDLNLSTSEVITRLDAAIAKERASRVPGERPERSLGDGPPGEPPAATPPPQ